MRKLLFFLLIILYPFACVKAQKMFLPDRLLYNNSGGEKGTSYFEYDGNSKLIKARWQLDDSSRWSINYYIYNEQNQLIDKYREFSDSLTSSLKYQYDQNGNKISEDFTRSDGIHGISTFVYNVKNIPEKILCEKYNGWFDGEIIYTKWKNKYPISADILQNRKKIGTITFNYDNNSNLIKEYWETESGWNQTFNWVYKPAEATFTSSNVFISENNRFRLAKENYSYNGKTGGPSYFTYDASGALKEKVFVRSDSLKTTTSFEYDDNGILKKSYRNYSDGKTGVFTYEFNKDRKLVSRLFKRSDGIEGTEKYIYSSTGQLIRADWENFDNWLTGTITFEFNRSGLLGKGYFKGEKFDAELTFFYDDNGNLSKIHWNFSFGESQTYWFEYYKTE
ncbi:MAG: hypothetical protein JXR31_07675 [Prolixibacteraceae bacterium]|nr:hypothetical protein [Prolixibacteraceae bacterium]MBN2774111.1 hypothetical protein [Prolixibacteraceae bacterium]